MPAPKRSSEDPLGGFCPAIRQWFAQRLGEPSPPQVKGWPAIREGGHTLICAPTGSGKTLAAFLWAIDDLLRQGAALPDATQVLYISPLKALGNDVQKNLQAPLAELRALDASLPGVRVLVRSGDTPQSARAAMSRRPPHILVTTPESLYILLTSAGGRKILEGIRTVIVDEIHAMAGGKRGAHLALSLERLEALTGQPPQRIGLSATVRPLEEVGRLLAGAGRVCTLVDAGSGRHLDLAIEVPGSPLATVCSHETWQEIYARMAALIREHRTTLVFVNTRKLAERIAARLTQELGAGAVTSHHGSLARERRLAAEQQLKEGKLRALVATASLELGIDVGDVDLVIQAGVPSSIATFLQRVGRAGHTLSRTPKGRIFPLTRDELACAAGLLDSVRSGTLDITPATPPAADILAQQIVASCAAETCSTPELYARMKTAWPYRNLTRAQFDAVVALHAEGRGALLHRDGVRGRLRGTPRARLTALTSGGAIPDTADYQVLLEPEEIHVGSVHEDFAIEANMGDIFQLGNASWRILKVEQGKVRVADAAGAPPTLPFWVAEGPARTRELSEAVARVREHGGDTGWLMGVPGIPEAAASQLAAFLAEGIEALGVAPTQRCVVLERFFDESGGMQLVLHAPFGGRINRAWGLALRKRFCRSFGFELQAAANEEAIVLSLGPQHSFELDEVFDYLHPATARDVLIQALLAAPMFGARWRWNAQRSLMLERTRGGRRVPAPIIRMRSDDLLAGAFPQVMACGETLPPGDTPIPWEHPIVAQTITDCLTEAMDVDGFIGVLEGLRNGSIRKVALDRPGPSPFAMGVLHAMPYAFLDDAPLEERRTQAVMTRRALDPATADTLGALDLQAVARVRDQAWPSAEDAEQLHEALLWMGYATGEEARESGWESWMEELRAQERVMLEAGRWIAAETPRDEKRMLRGRLEALGPVVLGGSGRHGLPAETEPLLLQLERDGVALRCRLEGRQAWCDRRLLARIHRETLDRLRREIAPVSAGALWRFLSCWQHADEAHRLDGPLGVAQVARKLAGFEAPAAAWESQILPARVRGYRPDWMDQITLSGEIAWGRLWGSGAAPIRSVPICLMARADLPVWLALSGAGRDPGGDALTAHGQIVHEALRGRGALFTQELERATGSLPDHFTMGLSELIGHGRLTCDSFAGLRRLIKPARRHAGRAAILAGSPAGRWSLLREGVPAAPPAADEAAWFSARQLLARYGVLARRLITREKIPVPWREIARACRLAELRGDVRGGRFVNGLSGEQFALPEAVEMLRRLKRREPSAAASVSAADPLNLEGILTPAPRVAPQTRRRVMVG